MDHSEHYHVYVRLAKLTEVGSGRRLGHRIARTIGRHKDTVKHAVERVR